MQPAAGAFAGLVQGSAAHLLTCLQVTYSAAFQASQKLRLIPSCRLTAPFHLAISCLSLSKGQMGLDRIQ